MPSFFLIKNLHVNRENGDTDCEEIIGSSSEVDKYAQIYVEHGLALETLDHYLTESYMRSNILSPETTKHIREYEKIRAQFLENCFVEKQVKEEAKTIKDEVALEAYKEKLKVSKQTRSF